MAYPATKQSGVPPGARARFNKAVLNQHTAGHIIEFDDLGGRERHLIHYEDGIS